MANDNRRLFDVGIAADDFRLREPAKLADSRLGDPVTLPSAERPPNRAKSSAGDHYLCAAASSQDHVAVFTVPKRRFFDIRPSSERSPAAAELKTVDATQRVARALESLSGPVYRPPGPRVPSPEARGSLSYFPDADTAPESATWVMQEALIAFAPATALHPERLLGAANFVGGPSDRYPRVTVPADAGFLCWARTESTPNPHVATWTFKTGDDIGAPQLPRTPEGYIWRGDPNIAVDPSNADRVVITYLATLPLTFDVGVDTVRVDQVDLFCALSTDGGSSFRPAQRVPIDSVSTNVYPDIPDTAFAEDGTFFVTWCRLTVPFVGQPRYEVLVRAGRFAEDGTVGWFSGSPWVFTDTAGYSTNYHLPRIVSSVAGPGRYLVWLAANRLTVRSAPDPPILQNHYTIALLEFIDSRFGAPTRHDAVVVVDGSATAPTPVPGGVTRPSWRNRVTPRPSMALTRSRGRGLLAFSVWSPGLSVSDIAIVPFQTAPRGGGWRLLVGAARVVTGGSDTAMFLPSVEIGTDDVALLVCYATEGPDQVVPLATSLVPGESPLDWDLGEHSAQLALPTPLGSPVRFPGAFVDLSGVTDLPASLFTNDRVLQQRRIRDWYRIPDYPLGPRGPLSRRDRAEVERSVREWYQVLERDRLLGDYLSVCAVPSGPPFGSGDGPSFVAAWAQADVIGGLRIAVRMVVVR